MRNVRSIFHNTESISFLGPKIQGIVSTELNEQSPLNLFKKAIKKCPPEICPCRLCKKLG